MYVLYCFVSEFISAQDPLKATTIVVGHAVVNMQLYIIDIRFVISKKIRCCDVVCMYIFSNSTDRFYFGHCSILSSI